MIMPFCIKHSLHSSYACVDIFRPFSNTIGSIFSTNSIICVETWINITMVQEALCLCQSAFARGKPCIIGFFYLCSSCTYQLPTKEKNFRIQAFSPFSRGAWGKSCLGLFVCFLELCGLETILHLSRSQDSSTWPCPGTLGVALHIQCPRLFSKRPYTRTKCMPLLFKHHKIYWYQFSIATPTDFTILVTLPPQEHTTTKHIKYVRSCWYLSYTERNQ